MIARLCYQCGAKWEQHDGEPLRILCPVCQYERVKPREQRDLRRLKEATKR